MSRRIDIELTSRTGQGAYTWRAAGAKQPRGTLDAELVPAGTAVGDVVRAELESGLEGFAVVAVLAREEKAAEGAEDRIEVLGGPRRGPGVSVSYAPGTRGRRDERGTGRREHPGRGRGPRERTSGRGPRERPSDRGREGDKGAPGSRREPHERRGAPGRRDRRPPIQTAHRNELLAGLGPEQLPVAEQLLRGGMPAVRQALAEHGARQPEEAVAANRDAVLAIAEQLLPRVTLATWKDRAAAAQASGKELRLRELRAVVAASRTVTLDDDARALARALHETLDARVKALREEWLSRVGAALDEGRVVDGLQLSARPPEPGTRLPAELAVRLSEAAGAALRADLDPDVWSALLDAVVDSPVRRTVKPNGIPAAATEVARRAAGSVPELARLLGLPIPPPPPPRRVAHLTSGGGAGRAGGR